MENDDRKKILDRVRKTMDLVSDLSMELTPNGFGFEYEYGHENLTMGRCRVYMFFCRGTAIINSKGDLFFSYDAAKPYRAIKIGKAGENSDPRYTSQPYLPDSPSEVAYFIRNDPVMRKSIGAGIDDIGEWIKRNTFRVNVVLEDNPPEFTMELVEAALHHSFRPVYESNRG